MRSVQGMKRRAVLLSLIDKMNKEGSWTGETHVQKLVYFLQEMLNAPLGFDFILYKHGPFSFDLRDELTAMRADDQLGLGLQPPYGPSLRLGPVGDESISLYPKTAERYKPLISFMAERLSTRGVSELERLSTALYVTKETARRGLPDTVDARADEIHSLKPHIPVELARSALQEVDRLTTESEQLKL